MTTVKREDSGSTAGEKSNSVTNARNSEDNDDNLHFVKTIMKINFVNQQLFRQRPLVTGYQE